MRIIPVIDFKGGLVVRGIAGRREEYRPVESRLVPSAQPAAVARAFRDQLGLHELYVADLDAISGAEPAWAVYAELLELGLKLWVDAGLRDVGRAVQLGEVGISGIVAGLETLSGPELLRELLKHLGAQKLVFSLDLKEGQPIGELKAWEQAEATAIAQQALDLGVGRMIALDLARVGAGLGAGTEDLCVWLRGRSSRLEIVAGGGVRDSNDLQRLSAAGADAVLVASALHDGRLAAEDIRRLSAGTNQR